MDLAAIINPYPALNSNSQRGWHRDDTKMKTRRSQVGWPQMALKYLGKG